MTTIDSSLYLHNQQLERVPSPELGKDEFLKILMTQLQNQDPTSPMDDSQFISQMASFSQLEQTMNMANSIDQLVQKQNVSPILQYSHMIGKDVSYHTYDEDTGAQLDTEMSTVIAVSQYEGQAVLELENDEKIYAESITQVSEPEADTGTESIGEDGAGAGAGGRD
ncbi:flagellar hook assembly protein FlgD [Lentibacillus sp. CBA3610]|uniref:flagellar hook assembly protein FlgD n=1 Tax=Lentibacillus sp. CBA3610 TaxID=2518176 RepID=UPI0015957CF5|nr:flagellar hook assembly protein FlgD [Lentibacillus sp. CBA3610]QKY69036.1 flagellar hook assembly protein FlgD [Lentibacillus sp. CBA3610]